MIHSKWIFKLLVIFSILFALVACTSSPNSLRTNLKLAGKNKSELDRVINHYSSNPSDSLKRKAALFLIENMDVHFSYVSKKWDNFQVELDTLFNKEARWQVLRSEFKKLHEKYAYGLKDIIYVCDLQTVSAQFLIYNIDKAFETWKSPYCNFLSFDDFCEYILPYRISTEPLGDWRTELNKQFMPSILDTLKGRKDSARTAKNICNALKNHPHGNIAYFPNDIPDYNVHLLSIMRLGTCTQYTYQAALGARSLGIPVAIDFTPQWATRSMGHDWNSLILSNNKFYTFGIGDNIECVNHIEICWDRIPLKIYRNTFAKQPSSLAMVHGKEKVPPLFRNPCFKDVTKDYYGTVDLLIKPHTTAPAHNKFAYLSVFDNKNWVPVAWAKRENRNYLFRDVNKKNMVCLPSYYDQEKVIPAAYPVILYLDGRIRTLKPNLKKREAVTLKRKYQTSWNKHLGEPMIGGKFQVSNTSNFKNAVDIFTIDAKPEQYYQIVDMAPTAKYKYFRYLSPNWSSGQVADIEVYEPGVKKKLTGKIIGNNNPLPDCPRSNAFDGDAATRSSTVEPDGTWIGLEFDTPKSINKLIFVSYNDNNCICNKQEYELFYWDNEWASLGKRIGTNTYRLVYKNIPSNALLLLHNLTMGTEERVFTYDGGEQVFW